MQPFRCPHTEQHISKQNYEISVVQKTHISRLEIHRYIVLCFGNLNVVFGSLSYCTFTVSRGNSRKLLGTITHMDDLLANEPGSNPIILEVNGYARILFSKKWKADYCPQWGYTYMWEEWTRELYLPEEIDWRVGTIPIY